MACIMLYLGKKNRLLIRMHVQVEKVDRPGASWISQFMAMGNQGHDDKHWPDSSNEPVYQLVSVNKKFQTLGEITEM